LMQLDIIIGHRTNYIFTFHYEIEGTMSITSSHDF
jgi:hypothetical protein